MDKVFNERKATQVAASFIKLCGGKIEYVKLMKLMYLAEREALLQWRRPITYDSYFSMEKGPVLSNTFDLIKEGSQVWSTYISPSCKYELSLYQDCPFDDLSQAEEDLIYAIFQQYGHIGKWDLVELLHKNLKEWKNPGTTSIPITYRDILKAGGKSEEEIDSIEEEIANVRYVAEILGS